MPEILIDQEQANQRLDRFLKKSLPYSTVQRLIRKRLIRVNDKRASADYILTVNDRVKYPESMTVEKRVNVHTHQKGIDKDWVLFEDDALLVLNKPAGIAVQGGTGITFCIDDAIKQYPYARLVHRLDRETSGVLLIALNAEMARHLAHCFKQNLAQKTYWAAVHHTPKPPKGTINQPLLKDEASKKMRIDKAGKMAESHYRALGYGKGISWLELSPKTGRTHQLRVHCQYLGCPILGDRIYGASADASFRRRPESRDGTDSGLRRNDERKLHLHAQQIRIPAPNSNHTLQFTAPLPPHMLALWRENNWSSD